MSNIEVVGVFFAGFIIGCIAFYKIGITMLERWIAKYCPEVFPALEEGMKKSKKSRKENK